MKKLLLFDLESIIKQTVKLESRVDLSHKIDTLLLNRMLKSKEYQSMSHPEFEQAVSNHWYFKLRGEDILEQIYDICGEVYRDTQLVDGFIPFLMYARSEGIKVALCSEGSIPSLEYLMYKLKLDDLFDFTVTRQQIAAIKNYTNMYSYLQVLAGVDTSECLTFQYSLDSMRKSSDARIDYVRIFRPDYLMNSSTLDRGAIALIRDFRDPLLKELVGK